MNESSKLSNEVVELQERVKKLEKSAWRANKELTALRESFAALKARSGIVGEVRPPLVFKDGSGNVVPQVETSELNLSSIEQLRSGAPVILGLPEKRRLKIQAFVEAQIGEPLHIVFHGAMQVGEQAPRFERVRSMRSAGLSFCAIADPTINLADELNLGWYVGHNAVDLREQLRTFIEALRTELAPPQIIFVGGSGGGFAALQNSAMADGSLAFVTDPQTIIPSYYPGHVSRLLRNAFDDFDTEAAMGEFGNRLSAVAAYQSMSRDNYVYYCQHREDEFHASKHLAPFSEVTGVPLAGGESGDGRVFLRWLNDGGHGPIRGEGKFEEALEAAKQWHLDKLELRSSAT